MTILSIILTIVSLFCLVIISMLIIIMKQRLHQPDADTQSLQLMASWVQDLRNNMSQNTEWMSRQLESSNQTITTRMEQTSSLMKILSKEITHIHSLGQQIRDFEHFLKAPNLRGRLGERLLTEILFQVLPKSQVELQYRFQNGATVDALIFTEKGNIAVDAKFPLEAVNDINEQGGLSEKQLKTVFRRAIGNHIKNISQKYIQPSQGTLDFALMYVPSESIYYQIISDSTIIEYAEQLNVLLVSPNNFYYLLRLVYLGLEGKKIEDRAAQILQEFSAFENQLLQLEKEMQTLNTHLNNAHKAGKRINQNIQGIGSRIQDIKDWDRPTQVGG